MKNQNQNFQFKLLLHFLTHFQNSEIQFESVLELHFIWDKPKLNQNGKPPKDTVYR